MLERWIKTLYTPGRFVAILVISAVVAEAIRYQCQGNLETFLFAWGFCFVAGTVISLIKI